MVNGEAVEESKVKESLEKLLTLRAKKRELDAEIAKRSADGALPPIMKDALAKLSERRSYLEDLSLKIEKQSQAQLDLSLNDL